MSEGPRVPASEIERVFREEYGRAVAVLVAMAPEWIDDDFA